MVFEGKNAAIVYETAGAGTDVLLLHGMGCDRKLMQGCMEGVFRARPGYRRWYVDLPGMGESDADIKNASADAILAALTEFVETLLPGPFLLAGESYGGYLAQGLAARLGRRVKGLLLLCAAFVPEAGERDLPERSALQYDEAFLSTLEETARAAFCAYGVVANEETYGRYCAELLPGLQKADAAFGIALRQRYAFSFDVEKAVFEGPALIVTGRQDNCVGYLDAWRRLQRFPRATFAALDLAGHNLQIERPALFDALVLDWLDRV